MASQSDDLLTEVRRLGSLPSPATTGNLDADLLAHADAEIRDTLVPLVLGVHEELYQRIFDVPVTSGLAAYRLNKRASLSRINTVQWLNTDGSLLNLPRSEPKQVAELALLSTAVGQPLGYYLEGSRVVLYPTPNLAGTLRLRAMVRPGQLALAAATGSKAASLVTTGATSYTLTVASGHGYTTSTPLDVVAGTPSFEYLALDTLPIAVTATTIELPLTAFSTPPAIGDFVCAPDTSPYVQLPVELHPALIELTTTRVLLALGKSSEASQHAGEAQRLVSIGIQGLTPRVDTADRKIVGGPMWRKGRGAGLWVR